VSRKAVLFIGMGNERRTTRAKVALNAISGLAQIKRHAPVNGECHVGLAHKEVIAKDLKVEVHDLGPVSRGMFD
jgi:hypothetical protein